MQKYFAIGYQYTESDGYEAEEGRFLHGHVWDSTFYSTEAEAIAAAQLKADDKRRDIQVLTITQNVKYPTPTYPVEAIS